MKENKEKITPESAQGKFLFFRPRSLEESARTMLALKKAGFKMRMNAHTPVTPENGREKNIGVIDGEFFCDPNESYNKAPRGNWSCTIDQIDENYVTPEQRFVLELFNKLSDRLDRIERRLDEIQEQVSPAPLDKAVLRRKDEKGGRTP